MEAGRETRPPRGALIVIAAGLIACVAAALLTTNAPIGATALTWGAKAPFPDSAPVRIPGGGAMRLGDAGIRATSPNVSGYVLYRVAAVLKISPGAAVGYARVRCSVQVPGRTLAVRTPKQRATYPQPSEKLSDQPVPPNSVVEFSTQGANLSTVSLRDAFGRFTSEPGVKVEWGKYQPARQGWDWGLPAGLPAKPLTLAFASIWRTTATPAARIACTLTTGKGMTRVKADGALKK